MTTLQITLPDDLARDLAEAGLLESQAIEAVLRERLRANRIAGFWKLRAAVEADPLEPMTDDQINAEIAAYRNGQRVASGS